MAKPLVFISYSPADEALKDQLLSHLDVLGRAGLVEVWSADQIGAGAEWQAEIDRTIDQAKVALLLVTANFLNSDFILDEEVPALLQRREKAGLVIVPVIAKACAWQRVDWLARLVGHPERVKPIWRGPDSPVDETLALLANYVAKLVAGEPPLDTDWPPPEQVAERQEGDSIAGDKVMGDQIAGDKIAGDKIVGDKVLGDKKNVLQIGALNIPLLPLVIGIISLVAILGFVSYRTFSPAAAPTPTPPQNSLFDVLVADIGQIDTGGQPTTSDEGRQISERIFESLQLEFENLPVGVQQDFKPVVWHDRLRPLPGGQKIGLIGTGDEAAQLAQDTGAAMVVYGNLDLIDDPSRFTPEFYVASLDGEADGIVGSDQFGAPIELSSGSNGGDLAALNLNKKLNTRTVALSRFTLGLMYDLSGFHRDALDIFQTALDALDLDETGAEPVFNYFAGRSALFLGEDETALDYFQAALEGDYPRAHIGLGSVHQFRAQAALRQGIETDDIDQAITQYQAAVNDPALSSTLKTAAQLGLGQAYRVKGDILARLAGQPEEAFQWLDRAVKELEAVLDPLRETQQYRYLGQAYLTLGAIYTLEGRLRADPPVSKIFYEKAHEAFDACIALKTESPADDTLTQDIIKDGCESSVAILEKAESILEEK
ncbi:MAG: toll/interleukin-1 receptor domain-containing protein [Anaerolineales bacterium]|nr:toll/interleukin-1 receptor domain-containing protein [Anaerolineales bacterium]